MTREEYIRELRARIAHLPKEEREAAMSYYVEYLEDAAEIAWKKSSWSLAPRAMLQNASLLTVHNPEKNRIRNLPAVWSACWLH